MRAALALALCGCTAPGGAPDLGAADLVQVPNDLAASDGPASLIVYSVPPAATDPGITKWTEDHLALRDPTVAPNGQLLLFLPGSTLLPSDYRLLLATAANQGYLVVGLRYPNDWDASGLNDPADPGCTRLARLEVLDGVDRTSVLDVGVTDSVVHRLVALLAWLEQAHPGEGWGGFTAAGQPSWASIAAAGHSFGSGMAALIGIEDGAARMVMLAGPNDFCTGDTSTPAPWLLPGGLTPPAARFGFGHLADAEEPRQIAAWSALGLDPFGMPASSVNVDKQPPPYEHAHELKTDALPSTGSDADAHRSVACDAQTPLTGSIPQFDPAWRYLLGP